MTKDDHSRPITLYVEKVQQPDLEYIERRRITTVDVELSNIQAQELTDYLQSRKDQIGAIRIRLSGRLVLA